METTAIPFATRLLATTTEIALLMVYVTAILIFMTRPVQSCAMKLSTAPITELALALVALVHNIITQTIALSIAIQLKIALLKDIAVVSDFVYVMVLTILKTVL
jgi:uncharacterized metal-binding protein